MDTTPDAQKLEKRQKRRKGDDNLAVAAKEGGINFIGKLFTYVVSLVFTYLMARLLGADSYGLYKLGHFFAMISGAICHVGLEGGIKRYIPIALNKKDKDLGLDEVV